MSSYPSVDPESAPAAAAPPPSGQVLHELCVEQVMRCTDDESLALAIAAATTEREMRVTIGMALPTLADQLRPGTPLFATLAGEPLDVDWRTQCPPRPDSLFAELEFLRPLCPSAPTDSLLTELVAARSWLER